MKFTDGFFGVVLEPIPVPLKSNHEVRLKISFTLDHLDDVYPSPEEG